MDMKTVITRIVVGTFGALIAVQSLPFLIQMLQNIKLFIDGWHGALLKGIVMGAIGLLIFSVGGWMVKAALTHKEKYEVPEEETTTAQTAE